MKTWINENYKDSVSRDQLEREQRIGFYTAITSGSHQGRLSPPLKKEPTESKNLPTPSNLDDESREGTTSELASNFRFRLILARKSFDAKK
jgi:hypothetical protein